MNNAGVIDVLMESHDDDPLAALAVLRNLQAGQLAPSELGRAGWLVNHVMGERFGLWEEALARQMTLAGDDESVAVLRCRAIAARMAGSDPLAARTEQRLAECADISLALAARLVRFGMVQHQVPVASLPEACRVLGDVLASLSGEEGSCAAGRLFAAALNNSVSALLEHPEADPSLAIYGETLLSGARQSRRLWGEAGGWIQQERAEYLLALCSNKLGLFALAREAANNGLALIVANGGEPVDQAFLLLEQALALRGLGDLSGEQAARQQAKQLADAFDEPGLRDWFERMAAR